MRTLKYSNNNTMPAFGLGTWKSKPGEVYEAVKSAIKAGYRHIDCAPVYGNEKEVGQAINECIQDGTVSREDLWITSKLWNADHDNVIPALNNTLSDLQLDYVDLYLIHWPVSTKPDVSFPQKADDFLTEAELPISKTWKGMESAVDKGLAKHIGVSNFGIEKLKELLGKCSIKPEMNQVEAHPYFQQIELLSFCHENDIHLTAYAPLGSSDRAEGMKGENEPSLLEDPVISEIAESKNVSTAQVLIAWALQRGTSVIPKSVNPGRIAQNFEASVLELTDEEMKRIAALDRGFRYIDGSFWVVDGGPYTIESLWA